MIVDCVHPVAITCSFGGIPEDYAGLEEPGPEGSRCPCVGVGGLGDD